MNYKVIFLKAYLLTTRNPVLWMFGLFLSSGFNLNIFYALVSDRSGVIWEAMRNSIQGRPLLIGISGVSAVVVFVFLNYLKAWFISEAHEHIHPQGNKCKLCVKREERQEWPKRFPDLSVVVKVLLASVITILASSLAAVPLNYLVISHSAPSLIGLTAVAGFIIICAIACWNSFAVFYIILHGQSFGSAARLSFDLLSMRTKQVFEFVFLLLIVYLVTVGIGSFLITMAQVKADWSGLALPLVVSGKAVFGLLFGIWVAITNTFFNFALLLFFDQLVKPVEKEEVIPAVLPQSAP